MAITGMHEENIGARMHTADTPGWLYFLVIFYFRLSNTLNDHITILCIPLENICLSLFIFGSLKF